MKITVGHKVSLLAIVAGGILIALGISVHSGFRLVTERSTEIVTITAALHNHSDADMMHDALRADVIAALLGVKRNDPEGIADAVKDVHEHEKEFRDALEANGKLMLNAKITAAISDVAPQVDAYIKSAVSIVTEARKDPAVAEAALPAFFKSFSELEGKLGEVSTIIEAEAARLNQESALVSAQFTQRLWIATALALAVLAALGFFITRSIPKPFLRIIEQLGQAVALNMQSSHQVSATSSALADDASTQAASLEESSASLEEISSMAKRNSDNAHRANDLTKQARSAADAGTQDVEAMNRAMEAIKSSSDGIAKIIKTIDEIAFQTNILALNAAVEAARAGEAGAGFAVVAEEVRALAQRSAAAARETAEKIDDSVAKSHHGASVCAKVAGGLKEIAKKTRAIDELVGEISQASKEQTVGLTQVNQAVTQMDKLVQTGAARAQEGAAVAQELSAQCHVLDSTVRDLALAVGGTGAAPSGGRTGQAASRSAPPVADDAVLAHS